MIFFDLDDTLLDYKTSQDVAARAFALRYPQYIENAENFVTEWDVITEREMMRYVRGEIAFQQQRRNRIRSALGLTLSDKEADALFGEYYVVYEECWQLFPEVPDVLDELLSEPLGIITNGDGEHQRYKLEKLGILSRFTHVLSPGDAGVAKPSPVIFHLAAQRASRRASECWYVGDNYHADYQGALASGFKSVWLNRYGSKEECDEQCMDLREFLARFRAAR
ncbi:MAG: HAD family hydrolase [Gammaproteobacteria bacterium]|nr:HAD family hydrolase [Gammaproteobacteria bacterium]MDP2142459.1 HAD family hydrolase [Gammaproteobacteria bacterium]MDP2348784.1 HAD family hydrolase [Gammaproteobacteria bacterium]